MADEKFQAPPETPHFTSDDASDAGPETPSVAPDVGPSEADPDANAADGTELADDIAKTAIEGPHN